MRTVWIRIFAVVSTGCALSLASPAHAQRFGASEQAAHMSGLRIDRSMLVGPLAASPASAMPVDAEATTEQTLPREVSLFGSKSGSGVMLEMTRTGPDGQFVRPRLLIGRSSPELRSWMSSVGIVAERCMLPQFRGRLKRAEDTGKVGAAVLVSARCTFF